MTVSWHLGPLKALLSFKIIIIISRKRGLRALYQILSNLHAKIDYFTTLSQVIELKFSDFCDSGESYILFYQKV